MGVSKAQAMDWLKRNWKIVLAVVVVLAIWMAWRHLTSTPIGKHASKIADQPAAVAIQLGDLTAAVKRSPANFFGIALLFGLGMVGVLGLSSKKGRVWLKSAKERVTEAIKSGVDRLSGSAQEKFFDATNKQANDAERAANGEMTEAEMQKATEDLTEMRDEMQKIADAEERAQELEARGDHDAAREAREDAEDSFEDSMETMAAE